MKTREPCYRVGLIRNSWGIWPFVPTSLSCAHSALVTACAVRCFLSLGNVVRSCGALKGYRCGCRAHVDPRLAACDTAALDTDSLGSPQRRGRAFQQRVRFQDKNVSTHLSVGLTGLATIGARGPGSGAEDAYGAVSCWCYPAALGCSAGMSSLSVFRGTGIRCESARRLSLL